MLTLDEAVSTGCCRICGGRMLEPGTTPMGYPKDWKINFGRMVYPIKIVLNFGKEFAHPDCIEKING